ncbi:Outer membrane receptor proteins, mostly Fe transport [Maribacter sedimenticola]|uniref:Outer membrane receptor proteins, mostly Fe transport n=1 Tax=Maribacter sedimenticola TaxID=228956 RepID=A0ABY1SJX8_9FLAO|nr:outer membrane beta-barrel family protein [Maribacter sedimenticola]SNR60701.1 Outer membrane receptor proteins, mostly Fe transport [Maribacter sedimenticola]
MRRDLITTLLLLFTTSLAFSQDFTITGLIMDSEEQPVVLANIILLTNTGDFIKGTVTDDKGFYMFKSVTEGEYSIAASYIENTVESPVFKLTKDMKMPTLRLNNAQLLDEVVVTHQKPKIEHLADRHIFNIENTALAEGDIWDVLKRTPGVMVMNNKLYINGSSKVNIMINGKRINLPEEDIINLLTGNSASNVESIEVITSPPAKYSAEGGLVLDIKMKKNLVSGYNGAVFNRYTQGVLPKHTIGMDHFFKGRKIDFSTNYSFSHNRNWARYTDITSFFEDGQESEQWTAEQKSVTKEKKHNLNVFLDIQLDEKNTLSVTSNGSFTPNRARRFSSQTAIEDLDGELTAQLQGLNTLDNDMFNSANYIDWVHKINDKGATLSTNAHFTYYDNKREQVITNDIVQGASVYTSENTLEVSSDQIINLYSLQTDLTYPFNDHTTLETGLRLATINSEAGIEQIGFDTAVEGVQPTEFGVFNYDEQIYAGYISLNNNWENWKMNVGLRGEYTDSKGELNTGVNTTTRSYFNVFPSLSVSYTIDKNAFYLKSFRRITRPRYGDINPFQFYYSANSIEEGNPELKPAYSDYLQLDYVYDKTYKLVLFASKKSNEQSQQVFQDNTANILRTQYINLETNYYYGLDASISKNLTSYWNLFFLISHYYDKDSFRDPGTGLIVENDIWTTHTRATNSFTLLSDKSLYADLTFTHFTPRISGNAKFESFSKLGLAFRKTLWNKAASLSLAVEDIFNNGNYNSTRNYLDQRNSISTRWENRLFVFGFRYKFGNTKIRDNYKRKNTDEGKRL